MRLSELVSAILLLVASATASAYCNKPQTPTSMATYGEYSYDVDDYIQCMHRENVLQPLERGTLSGNAYDAAKRRHEAFKEEMYAERESVRRQLQSGSLPGGSSLGGNSASSSNSSPLQGNNCSELQRDATQRMQQIQQRLQYSNSLCEKYRLGQELGEIGTQIYSRCRILDPNGTNLAAAEQMVRDGRQGQAQACTR